MKSENNESKADKIRRLSAEGKSRPEIKKIIGFPDSYVDTVLAKEERKKPAAPPPAPFDCPALDPSKPLGPQCESAGVSVLFDAVKNGSKTQRIQASKELLRIAARDKVPPPLNRKFKIILGEIDYKDDGVLHIISRQPIEIRL